MGNPLWRTDAQLVRPELSSPKGPVAEAVRDKCGPKPVKSGRFRRG